MSTEFLSLESLINFYAAHGVGKVFVKSLAANDNSKNQIYFGPGFDALNLFPIGPIVPSAESADPIFKAQLQFLWIGEDSSLVPAPSAQIILYPQYPEVRFSGFLKGANRARLKKTRELMTSRTTGRVLFLGVHEKSATVIGSVFDPESPIAKQFMAIAQKLTKATDIFFELLTTFFAHGALDPRKKLLEELCRISRLGWIDSKRLDNSGMIVDCNSSQCGGYTLEAEFGITPNARSEPDFMGWELKQHSGSVLTLMTPEPTGGIYKDNGVEHFVRAYGYPDKRGRVDRINFGGTHYCDKRHLNTRLTLNLSGYDNTKNVISNALGGLELTADDGTVTASWSFSGLLSHWAKKHQNAAYVSSKHRTSPSNQYRFDKNVLLCVGTSPLFLIRAISSGQIYYDPGIKIENASGPKSKLKTRSQFRVKLKNLASLYHNVTTEDVSSHCSSPD